MLVFNPVCKANGFPKIWGYWPLLNLSLRNNTENDIAFVVVKDQ
jgi:hypothetical protein